jgi:ubiquitin-activating enzyme E1 C
VFLGISGVDYKLVQGVVKHIIPAVASTNAAISAVCATEVFKLATSVCKPLNNYMVFNNADGIYSYSYPNERKVLYFNKSLLTNMLYFLW